MSATTDADELKYVISGSVGGWNPDTEAIQRTVRAVVSWLAEHDAKVRAEALREVRDAWVIPGRVPTHHHRMRIQLRRDWPVLAGALDRIEREAGLK